MMLDILPNFIGRIGATEIIIIVAILLLFFGAKKIPELMRGMGRGVKEFKDALNKDYSEEDESQGEEFIDDAGSVYEEQYTRDETAPEATSAKAGTPKSKNSKPAAKKTTATDNSSKTGKQSAKNTSSKGKTNSKSAPAKPAAKKATTKKTE